MCFLNASACCNRPHSGLMCLERRQTGDVKIAGQVDLVSLADKYKHFVMVLPPAQHYLSLMGFK